MHSSRNGTSELQSKLRVRRDPLLRRVALIVSGREGARRSVGSGWRTDRIRFAWNVRYYQMGHFSESLASLSSQSSGAVVESSRGCESSMRYMIKSMAGIGCVVRHFHR